MFFQGKELIYLARKGIREKLFTITLPLPELQPELRIDGASFVTLTIDNSLRGCIGTLVAHQELYKDIIENGINAAFKDPRFSPVSQYEYDEILVEVSVLTSPEEVKFHSKEDLAKIIRPGIDGVILNAHGRRATFLPQVWEQLNDFDQFFSHLSLKAGLGAIPDFDHATIQRYQVEKFHE